MSNPTPEFKSGGFVPGEPMYVDRRNVEPIIRIHVTTNAREAADRLAELHDSPDAMVVTYDRNDEK